MECWSDGVMEQQWGGQLPLQYSNTPILQYFVVLRVHDLPLLISRSGRKLLSPGWRWIRVRESHPNSSKNTGVATAPPMLITINCHRVPQPNSGARPVVS